MTGMSTKALLLVLATLTAVGCVAQGQHDSLMTQNRRQGEQIVELRQQLEAKEAELRAALSAQRIPDPALLASIEKLRSDRDALEAALAEAKQGLADAAGFQVGGPLPAALDRALVDLAAANPGLMEYDSKRGMVKFRSDLTFALGSTQISQAGIAALGQLAGIINSPIAAKYEVRVVGHTDNVPVANVENVRRYGDNWGLSAFRAIAVKDVLAKGGVTASRIEVAGRGQFVPVVANGPKGAEANRRVEIFLVPLNRGSVAATDPAGQPIPAAAQNDPAPEGPEAFK